MTDSSASRELILLLGIDEKDYGNFALEQQAQNRTACTLSVGSDMLSPARIHKARHDVPNEDALLVIDQGRLTLLAVADAHYGHESSHELLSQFAKLANPIPGNPLAALELLQGLTPTNSPNSSETSLVLAILDRGSNQVFGYSFGDSSLVALCPDLYPDGPPRLLNTHNSCYVNPDQVDSLDPRIAQEFAHALPPGSLLLAYTDGIDGCHYNHPETSITLAHIHDLHQEHKSPAALVKALTVLALEGLPPNPGGQDNIAAICTTC